jgi:hypothetical protein
MKFEIPFKEVYNHIDAEALQESVREARAGVEDERQPAVLLLSVTVYSATRPDLGIVAYNLAKQLGKVGREQPRTLYANWIKSNEERMVVVYGSFLEIGEEDRDG